MVLHNGKLLDKVVFSSQISQQSVIGLTTATAVKATLAHLNLVLDHCYEPFLCSFMASFGVCFLLILVTFSYQLKCYFKKSITKKDFVNDATVYCTRRKRHIAGSTCVPQAKSVTNLPKSWFVTPHEQALLTVGQRYFAPPALNMGGLYRQSSSCAGHW